MKAITIKLFIIFFFIGVCVSTYAQGNKNLTKGTVIVKGTSTMHDWEMTSASTKGFIKAEIEGSKVNSVSEVSFSITAETLKSGKSGMDKNAYKAIKTESHKEITFTSKSVSIDGDKISAKGTLKIAGTSKQATITGKYVVNGGTVSIKGSTSFKMTSYNVEPPTAMFGSIKTGDEIEISFDVNFK